LTVAASSCGGPDNQNESVLSRQSGIIVNYDTVPSCRTCAIAFHGITAYGSNRDLILLRRKPHLVALRSGTLVAYVPNEKAQEIIAYNSQARGVPIGSIGGGPGEYTVVHGVAAYGDSLVVAHDANRLTVYDANGGLLRTLSLPLVVRGPVVADSKSMVVVGSRGVTARGRERSPDFHIISPRGEVLSSGGPSPVMFSSHADWLLADGPDGRVWAAERAGNYRLAQIDSTGRTVHTIVRSSPEVWNVAAFATRASVDSVVALYGRRDMTRALMSRPRHSPIPPTTSISGIHQTGDTLWVSLHVAAEDWRTVPLEYAGYDVEPSESSQERLYDTVVEVLELQSGRLIARGALPGTGQLLNDGSFARVSYDEDGIVRVEHYQVRLLYPQTRR
jgi:hypothetical protein